MNFFLISLSAIAVLLFSSFAPLQSQIPGTDIFVLDFKLKDGRLQPGVPRNITKRAGYDNQPHFLPNGKSLLFTSIREDGQADIYKCDLADYSISQLTRTTESEFSANAMPDGKHFSVVRVEKDSSQRLWKFPLAGGAPSLVLEKVKPVGYHAWINANTIALYVLGTPSVLQVAEVSAGQAKIVGGNIGRSLHKIPQREAFSFVHKINEEMWIIKVFDLKASKTKILFKAVEGSEDCAWTPDGLLLMGSGSKLYQRYPERNQEWIEIADFSSAGVRNLTRLAVSPKGNRIAVVSADQNHSN